jgi:hypothetical protein
MPRITLLLRTAPIALLLGVSLLGPAAAGQSRREVKREAAREEARRIAEREEALSVKGSDWLKARKQAEAGQKALKSSDADLKKAEKLLKRAQQDVTKAEGQVRAAANARLKAEKQIADSTTRMKRAEDEYEARREAAEDAGEPR